MINTPTSTPLIYSKALSTQAVDNVLALVADANIPLQLTPVASEQKLSQKVRKQLSADYAQPVLILDDKAQLSLLTGQLNVSPSWCRLQRRVSSAGRKSELLLQACKLNVGKRVLDGTAGFGHDSLILASTGAQVVMLERHPMMALLLMHEQQQMVVQANWQKLMQRLEIIYTDAVDYMAQQKSNQNKDAFNVVYLDPMFPDNSYEHTSSHKGAKVGKHMQALHDIALPPDITEEQALLDLALQMISAVDTASGGRVVVKRPVAAPSFANAKTDEQWQNDVLRFDAYFTHQPLIVRCSTN